MATRKAIVISLVDERNSRAPCDQEKNLLKRDLDSIWKDIQDLKKDIQKNNEDIQKAKEELLGPRRSAGRFQVLGTESHLDSIGVDSRLLFVTMMRCKRCGETWNHVSVLDGELKSEGSYWFCPNGCNSPTS